ncbi:hypothetical protein R1sor_005016 [Riccia sorocarpa]|uniref:Myb/SANT-like DNA-binding domain-containing protein n=1 Tax=Riccia sorocarpa TaxID=122646 RepID=A0ABD3HIB2_9MARC
MDRSNDAISGRDHEARTYARRVMGSALPDSSNSEFESNHRFPQLSSAFYVTAIASDVNADTFHLSATAFDVSTSATFSIRCSLFSAASGFNIASVPSFAHRPSTAGSHTAQSSAPSQSMAAEATGSHSQAEQVDLEEVEDIHVNPIRNSVKRKMKTSTPREPQERSRIVWKNEWVLALLDLKKQEWLDDKTHQRREVFQTADSKWRKIQTGLLSKGCNTAISQIKWKWESLLMNYKQVKIYHKRTGVAPFATLAKSECKKDSLPLDFEHQWFELMDNWYGTNPQVEPPCLADSSNPFVGLDIPQTPESEQDITGQEDEESTRRRTSSGVRRKSGPKPTNVISEGIDKLSAG